MGTAGWPADYNIFCFDPLDLFEDLESDIKQRALSALSSLGVKFDVKNKACVGSFSPAPFRSALRAAAKCLSGCGPVSGGQPQRLHAAGTGTANGVCALQPG